MGEGINEHQGKMVPVYRVFWFAHRNCIFLEKNLFSVKPRDIADVRALATMMDGNFTYRDGF